MRLKSKLGPVWEQVSFISSLRDSLVISGKTEAQVYKEKMARAPILKLAHIRQVKLSFSQRKEGNWYQTHSAPPQKTNENSIYKVWKDVRIKRKTQTCRQTDTHAGGRGEHPTLKSELQPDIQCLVLRNGYNLWPFFPGTNCEDTAV